MAIASFSAPTGNASASESLVFSSLGSSCLISWPNVSTNSSYGNMFTAGSNANIVRFDLRNPGTNWSASSIDFFGYDANSQSKMSSTKLATFTPTENNSGIVTYTGLLSVTSGTKYWYIQQFTSGATGTTGFCYGNAFSQITRTGDWNYTNILMNQTNYADWQYKTSANTYSPQGYSAIIQQFAIYTTPSELISNYDFSNGTASWSSSAGWNSSCAIDGSGGNNPCVGSGILKGGYNTSIISQNVTGINSANTSEFKFEITIATNNGNYSDQWYALVTFKNSSNSTVSTLRIPSSGNNTEVHTERVYSASLLSSGTANFETITSALVEFSGKDTGWGGNYGPSVNSISLLQVGFSASQSVSTPGAPTITGITPGNGQLSVAFSAPSSNGGASITNYDYSTNGGSTWTTPSPAVTTSPLVITGLTNLTTYNVQIRARNSAGAGTATASTSATPRSAVTITTPSSGLAATRGFAYSLTLSAAGGGSTKTYSVTSGSSGLTALGLSLNTSTGVISGTPSASGTASIVVRVTDNFSQTADTSSFTITVGTVPGAPTSPTTSGTLPNGVTGDGKLRASWTAPSSNGGNTITNYEVRYALADVLSWSGWVSVNGLNGNTSADTSTVLSGLSFAKSYVVQVRAVNAAGAGAGSVTSNASTSTGPVATTLGAPTNPTAVTGDSRVTLNFTANPITGGNISSSVLFNTMQETCNSESYWIVRSNVRYAHQFTAGGAATLTKVEFRLGAGQQQYPSQVKIVIYANGAGDTVGTKLGELTYASAGSNIAVYTGSVALSGSGTHWIEIQPTAAIANHYYCGTASTSSTGSAAGWSQNRGKIANGSNSSSWSYFVGTSYYYPMFRITAESSEAALNAITEYQYSLDGGSTWKSVPVALVGAGPSIAITGLTNGTTYDVRLRAVNSAGPGAIATFGQLRPGKGPSIPNNFVLGQNVGQITVNFTTPSDTGGLTTTYEYRIKNTATVGATPTYYPSGAQTSVPVSTVTGGGWTLCWSGTYGGNDLLTNLQNSCTGKYLLYAGGVKDASSFTLVGAGERESVFKTTANNVTTLNNGLYWYYNPTKSMGFAETSVISQNSADTTNMSATTRMSWHTGHCGAGRICGGWRVGSNLWLNSSTTYIRAIYQSSGSTPSSDEGWSAWASVSTSPASIVTSGTNNTVTISGITNDRTYSVQIRAKNDLGNSDATPAQNIDTRRGTGPTITTQPTNQNLTLNQTAGLALSVVAQAVGQDVLSYQWYKNGTAISGATSATYSVAGPVLAGNSLAGTYKVGVTGTLNNVASQPTFSQDVIVTVNPEPVIVTSPAPANGTVGAPYSSTLNVESGKGTAPFTWRLAPGATLPAGLSLTSEGRIVGTPTISSTAAAAGTTSGGAIAFNGTASYVSVPASTDWATGTGNFSIEWWQYQTDNNTTARIFSVDKSPNASLAVTFTGGAFVATVGGTNYTLGSLGTYKNTWTHFAFVREGNTIRAYKNGVLLGSLTTTLSASNSTSPLYIGSDTNAGSFFGGFISNFHFVKGSAIYSANFSPSAATSAVANTKLLLLASTTNTFLIDSSGQGKTLTNFGSSYTNNSPASGASSKDALQNSGFTGPLVSDSTKGWAQTVRTGGPAAIAGGGLIMSYGMPACTAQATAPMSEVQQRINVSTPGTVTFKIKVDARTWNRIGAGYSNPCHDVYQVSLSSPGLTTATTGRLFSNIVTADASVAASDTLNESVLWQEVTLTLTTTSANQVVTISLFGLDSGYWGGNYGPRFYDASLTVPGGGSSNNAATSVIVTDANGRTANATFTITISPEMAITTRTLPNAPTGASYSQTLTVTGGSGTYSWAVTGGNSSLPTGLSLATNGVISGNVDVNASSKSFTVSATDSNGAVISQGLSITVSSGAPGTPTNLTVGTLSSQTVPLTWTAPSNSGSSDIASYVITYSAGKGTDPDDTETIDQGTVTVNASGLTLPYALTGLKNGRTYSITVAAKNASQIGNATSAVTAKPVTVASAPTDLSTVLANGGITIRWKKPLAAGGNPITSYKAECQPTGSSSWITVSTSRVDQGDGGVLSVITSSELTVGTEYTCRVAAVTTTGDGAWITSASPITLATPPSVPQSVTTVTSTPGEVAVSWAKSQSANGAAITSYTATISRDLGAANEVKRSCTEVQDSTKDTGGYTCTITGVPKKGVFTLTVTAQNSVGQSLAATSTLTIAGTTQTITVPSQSSVRLGTGDFSVGATMSSGLPVQYSVANDENNCSITARGLVKPLLAGTCTVRMNQDGKDASGADTEFAAITQTTVNITITDRVPGTPRFNRITSGNATLTITWYAPSNTGGTVTEYKIRTSTDASTWTEVTHSDLNTLSKAVTGLTNGTEYHVEICANNATACSDWVRATGTYIPFTVPGTPTIDTATVTAATGSAVISWTAPASNGSDITGYQVTATKTGLTTQSCSVGGSATSCTIYSLENKNTYTIVLKARNAAGESTGSTGVDREVAGIDQTISLATTPAADGWIAGDPNYQIQASSNSGLTLSYATGNAAICTVSSSGSVGFVSVGDCAITISQNGSNSRYNAATSVVVNFAIGPAVPSAPTITGFTNATGGLTVAYNAPSRIGAALTTYTVTATAANETTRTCSILATSCQFNNLTKGVEYSFTVTATNDAGVGAASSARISTWFTVPAAPVLSAATANATDGRALDVSWAASATTGGTTILRYIATATAGGSSKSCEVNSSSSSSFSCVIRDLRAGTSYAVTVQAVNAVGNSTASNSISVTPGIAQVITVSSPASTISKSFGDANFRINATVDSGNTLTYSSSNTNVCTVDSSGLVQIIAPGSCTLTIAQPGATDANESVYKAATSQTISMTVSALVPATPRILSVTPGNAGISVAFAPSATNGGATISNYEYSLDGGSNWVTPDPAVTTSPISISGLTNGTTYSIKVRAKNSVGNSEASNAISVTPYAPATKPLNFVATGGNASVALSWSTPSDNGGFTITKYQIFKSISGTLTLLHETANETTRSFTDSSLAAGTTYEYQVRAISLNGATVVEGEFTPSVFATTNVAPTAPRSFSATASFSSSPSIVASWLAPSSGGGSSITGYTVTATPVGGGTPVTCTTNASTFTCSISNLTAGTSYSVVVTATSAAGTSVASTASTVTAIGKAGAPTSVTATGDNASGSATISWTSPASDGGSAISSYLARAYTGGSSTPLTCTKAHATGTTSYSCTITGLSYKTDYTFQVVTNNTAGASELSVASSSINLVRTQVITFTAITDKTFATRSVVLNATADSGLAVSFASSTTSVCTVSGSIATIVGVGTCTIVASQSGEGSPYFGATATSRSFAVTATRPVAVTLNQALPGASQITVSWSAAVDIGGSASKTYAVSYATSPSFSDEITVSASDTSTVLSGLNPGATYSIRVKVVTPDFAEGSAWSNLLQATVIGVPASPGRKTSGSPAVDAGVTAGAGIATVEWIAVDAAANGGSPLTGYRVIAMDGVTVAATCTTAGTSCVISGLDGSKFYTFNVVAINAVGESEPLEYNTGVQPGASQTITATQGDKSRGLGRYKVNATTNSGLPLAYSVTSATATDPVDGRSVCTIDAATGELTFDLAGTCVVKITQDGKNAFDNASGYLPATDLTRTFNVTAAAPSNVLNFSINSGNAFLEATWTKPTDDGGRGLKGYEVTIFATQFTGSPAVEDPLSDQEINDAVTGSTLSARRVIINDPDTLTYKFTGLTNGVSYTILVKAINNADLKSARS
jgi:hypothetical protein